MKVIGYNGSIEVFDTTLLIEREGMEAFFSNGLKGNKEIYLNKISSIQIKKSGLLSKGYIHFGFSEGSENKNSSFIPDTDKNTVLFSDDKEEDFLNLKSFIEKKIKALNNENQTNSYSLEIAKRMKEHLNNGKNILEAEALAKMEFVLDNEKNTIKTEELITENEELETTSQKISCNVKKKEPDSTLFTLFITFAIVILFFIFSIPSSKNSNLQKETLTKESEFNSHKLFIAEDRIKSTLREPDSFNRLNYILSHSEKGTITSITIEYTAKNGFGGSTREKQTIYF